VLTEAGSIRIDVGATGIDAVKGVAAGTMADPSTAAQTAHGMLVAPNLAAVYHDHFLSLRLDIDIDGAANTLIRQRLEPQPRPGDAAGRSLWTVRETPVAAEGPLPGAEQHVAPEVWRVVNPNLTNRLGQHPGYELRPGQSANSLLAAGDPAQRRSAFAAALSLNEADLLPDQPVWIGSTGIPFLFIPLRTPEAVDAAVPDMRALSSACPGERVGVFVFAPDAQRGPRRVYSRMFAGDTIGVPEDSATGSASGPLGAYVAEQGIVGESLNDPIEIVSLQGNKMGRPSLIYIRLRLEGGGLLESRSVAAWCRSSRVY